MIKFLISLLLASPLLASTLSGTVKRVADGDSLQLTDAYESRKARRSQ